MSELRWNPLMGEWVATATERQGRTFLPPADFCPLCPTKPGGFPTEIPEAEYDIVVFENRFPSLRSHPPAPAVEGTELYPVRPAQGVCEVVVYSSRHTSTLADESVEQIHQLVQVWAHRFRELDKLDFVQYVFMFENKGEAIGVTLHHPHGQIYAYPFIPPRVEHELKQCAEHKERTGRNLILDILEQERTDGRRIIAENNAFTAFIPFFARYPFETYIVARRPLVLAPDDFTPQEARDLAEILKQVLVAFDKLFNVKFPYMMVLHGRPSDKSGAADYSHYQFHIEFYPPLRTATKLKYLAGSESGAGLFINDTLAEVKAAELRAHIAPVVWQANDLG